LCSKFEFVRKSEVMPQLVGRWKLIKQGERGKNILIRISVSDKVYFGAA